MPLKFTNYYLACRASFFFLAISFLSIITQPQIYSNSSYELCKLPSQTSCLPCPIQCTQCSSPSTNNFSCTSCSKQYFLQNNVCRPCSNHCISCTSLTACTSCQKPFVLSPTTLTCSPCLIDNALACSSTVSASSCLSQFYLSNNNYCVSCLLNCKTCSSASSCTECNDNFYLNASVLTCNSCPPNCIECNQFDSSICMKCESGYRLTSVGSKIGCEQVRCLETIDKCQYCVSEGVCGQCEQFHYWHGIGCIMGASVLCENGATGMLPTACINECTEGMLYRAANSSGSGIAFQFLCIPYRTAVNKKGESIQQHYYYAYSNVVDLNALSGQSLTNLILDIYTQEYSYELSDNPTLSFASLSSFYRIQIRLKYVELSAPLKMTLHSQSQSDPTVIQTQSTTAPISTSNIPPTAISFSYYSNSIHSNNLKLTFNSSFNLIQLFLRIHRCPDYCIQCLNNELCQLCRQPQYMLGYECVDNCTVYYHFAPNRTCVLNCPNGYYYVNNGINQKYCELCEAPCTTCISPTKCLSCSGSFYFWGNYTCIEKCPDGYYKYERQQSGTNATNNTCERCISPCRTCSDKSVCLSCDSGFWNGSNCTTACGNGTYGNSKTKTCESCSNQCLTCANSSTLCTSCDAGSAYKYLHNRQCIQGCPEAYYPIDNASDHICKPCIPPCQTCSTNSICLSCSYNYFSAGECVAECPNDQYQDLSSNMCVQCDDNCLTCSTSASYCDSCQASRCLYQGKCVVECPSAEWYRQYTAGVNNNETAMCTCKACNYPCKTCSSQSVCLSCLQGYLSGTNCISQCPTGSYSNPTLKECSSCSSLFPNCSTCIATKCNLCENNFLLHSGKCMSSCPALYYSSSQQCYKCVAPCRTCSSFSKCLSCTGSYILLNTSCITQCPAGKFSLAITSSNNYTSTQCLSCSSPCLYCNNTSTSCTLCESNFYLHQNACYLNCSTALTPASSYYNQDVTSTCAKCMFPCLTCLTQYQCLSCSIGYLNQADFSCKSCVVGTYPDPKVGICQTCDQSCAICYSATFCTACNEGYYLYLNRCTDNVTLCEQNGRYALGRVCVLCSQPCKLCSGMATNCTKCLTGYIYFKDGNGSQQAQCLQNCPNGYYRNSSIGSEASTCSSCASQCTSCISSPDYCLSCISSYNLHMAEMSCVSVCPQYTYEQADTCMACKYPCLDCSSETNCLSCISGTLIGGMCYSSCSSGFFSNSNNVCEQCVSPCEQCVKQATKCTQCVSGFYLFGDNCVNVCPSETFPESESLKCLNCLGTCFECTDHANCTACSDGFYFYISQVTNYGQCVSSCPNGYYPRNTSNSNSASNTCLSCRSDCLTCTDDLSCILCNSPQVVLLGECLIECPQRMYSYQGVCQSCQAPCYNCSDTTTCISCQDDAYLLVGSAECIQGPDCPPGYYLLDGQLKCNSQCPSGYYHLSNRTCNAKGCASNQFKGKDWYCYQQCPDGFIGNEELDCVECDGAECTDGLFFGLEYEIINDDLLVYLRFTEPPMYSNGGQLPSLSLSPAIPYNVLSVYERETPRTSSLGLTQSQPQSESQPTTLSSSPTVSLSSIKGLSTLIFALQPAKSLQQTYLKISFINPLQTFANPLQHPSSILFIKGYDKYPDDLQTVSSFAEIFILFCALVGLIKNPFMTDFAQLVFILALNNVHYPLHLRSFLEDGKSAVALGLMKISQQSMQGSKGKFKYLVDNGLFSNALGNILIVIIGFVTCLLGYLVLKVLQKCCWAESQDNKVHQQDISGMAVMNMNRDLADNQLQQSNHNQEAVPASQIIKNCLSQFYHGTDSSSNLKPLPDYKILYLNRFIYFNYLPITLFTFTQLSAFTTLSGINTVASIFSIISLIFIGVAPFWLLPQKPKFTFLYLRKITISAGLILSMDYPIYCIGVFSVCNITAFMLIVSYSMEKWKKEMQMHAIGELLQLVLMVGFAVFVITGEGYATQNKVLLAWVLIMGVLVVLIFYLVFELFCFAMWVVKKLGGKDYIAEWISQDLKELSDGDGTDSETMKDSMKDHQETRAGVRNSMNNSPNSLLLQGELNQQNDQNDSKEGANDDNCLDQSQPQPQSKQRQVFVSPIKTSQIQVSPSKNIESDQQNNLFWNYDMSEQSDQPDGQEKQRPLPKMLIRCINEFSDVDVDEGENEGENEKDEERQQK